MIQIHWGGCFCRGGVYPPALSHGRPNAAPTETACFPAYKLFKMGYSIIKTDEAQYPVKFYDVGALVFWAKVIVWEFPAFLTKHNVLV